jgi:hypothetical protein
MWSSRSEDRAGQGQTLVSSRPVEGMPEGDDGEEAIDESFFGKLVSWLKHHNAVLNNVVLKNVPGSTNVRRANRRGGKRTVYDSIYRTKRDSYSNPCELSY